MRKLSLLALLLTGAAVSHAAVVLTVDISNLSAVTFTATPAFSQSANNTIAAQDGITLLNFFALPAPSPVSFAAGTTSTLEANGMTSAYNAVARSTLSSPGAYLSLNLYRSGSSQTENFATDTAAFTGALTLNLGANSSALLGLGSVGDIVGGDSSTANPLIGQFAVIPEPATTGLLIGLGGLLAVAGLRRRRSRRA